MNRNTENHFANTPVVDRERSTFTDIFNHKTTFDAGQLIPFFVDQNVMPGDTYKLTTSIVIRSTTPKFPVMDQLVADIYYFKDEKRNLWEHWVNLMGENTAGSWAAAVSYSEPQLAAPSGGWAAKTNMDYMGIVPGYTGKVSALPLRMLCRVYNYWFRDQNYIAPVTEYKGDADQAGDNSTAVGGGTPFKVCRTHDYFSSVLPAPQKSLTPPTLPLGITAPVRGDGKALGIYTGVGTTGALAEGASTGNMGISTSTPGAALSTSAALGTGYTSKQIGVTTDATKSGLVVDLAAATAATVNALRDTIAYQIMLEADGRYGTRYPELIRGHYAVTAPSLAVFQKPEYIGGRRVALSMEQIAQTSSTDSTSPQGHMAAFSLTADIGEDVYKSFTEHSIIMGVLCVRIANHTYQQGIGKQWFRKQRLDYYWPELRNLGEMPVLNKYLYAQGPSVVDGNGNIIDDQVFGYQEAWAEYRYYPNRTSGEMRSTYSTPLDSWHYGDLYSSLPVAGAQFLEEGVSEVDRTLQVSHSVSNQFFADIAVKTVITREMPLYSVPGLMDHF